MRACVYMSVCLYTIIRMFYEWAEMKWILILKKKSI